MEGTVAWLLEMITKDWSKAGEAEEYEQRLESDADAVNIITMHSSKGLQFPLVFCPGISESNKRNEAIEKQGFIFANPENDYGKELELGSASAGKNYSYYMNQQLAEWMRLFYVGVTRAQYYCFIGYRKKAERGADDVIKPVEYLLNCHGIAGDLGKFNDSGVSFTTNPVMPNATEMRVVLPETVCPPLTAPQPPTVPGGFKIMSYSSLTANVHEHDFTPGAEEQITGGESSAAATGDNVPIFADFPGGALSGDCVHAVFEQLDFSCVNNTGWQDAPELRSLLEASLARFGRVAGRPGTEIFQRNLEIRRGQLAALVEQTLTTPILPGMRLADVKGDDQLAELEFYFSVPVAIAVDKLETLLRRHFHCTAWGDGALLNFDFAKSGFMNGKIDLVFKAGGKYWLADWKTNSLGRAYSNYTPDAIRNSMVASRYPVQAAIYTVALDRLLRQRLPDYCPEEHFGGVFYLYVRGMDGNSADTGVFHMPYHADFVENLKEVFPGGSL
jgi:exodeoxyribonuclease V beta subunit